MKKPQNAVFWRFSAVSVITAPKQNFPKDFKTWSFSAVSVITAPKHFVVMKMVIVSFSAVSVITAPKYYTSSFTHKKVLVLYENFKLKYLVKKDNI